MSRDILSAMRWLRKRPLFTAALILILALGIGANTAVFSIVDGVLFRALPYEAAGRMVRIEESSSRWTVTGVGAQDYERWRRRTDIFEKTASYIRDTVTITGPGEPDQLIAVRTAGLFPLLGVHARLGRALQPSDDQPGAPNVTVITDRLWQRRFHSDPAVIGSTISTTDGAYTIAGVMSPDFEFGFSDAELFVPMHLTAGSNLMFQVTARLAPGVTAARAQSAMDIVARQIEQEDPRAKLRLKIFVTLWNETPDRKYQMTLVLVLVAVGLVLLIACIDVSSLMLSRAVERQKEIAIRASLGAGLWRLIRQLLAESFVVAVAGSVAGIAVARLTLKLLLSRLAALPIVLPHLQRVALNGRVLLFNTVLCLLLAVLCSLAPVLLAARMDLQRVLRSGQTGAGPRGSSRLFSAMIAAEAAFAFLLLVGSGLMVRSLIRLQQEDHGIRPDHVLTLRVPVGSRTRPGATGKYDTKPRQMAYYREILERVKTVPGIKAAAVVNNLPLSGVNSSINLRGPDGQPLLTSTRTVSPDYFAAMGISIIAGRQFTDRDQAGAPGVAIVNEYLAHQFFPDRNPLGEHLPEAGGNSGGPEIVGVVRNTSQLSYELPVKAEVYMPYQQFFFAAFMSTLVVRANGDPLALAASLQKQVWSVDPMQPVVKVETMEDIISDSIWRPRFSAWIFTVLGALAVLLTSAGVYAVVAYTTTLRTKEVGIRIALGATPLAVMAVILRGAMIPLVSGLAASVVAALVLSKFLSSVLYGVSGADPLTYVAALVLLLIIGTAASARPAWRAANGDPLEALRTE